MAEPDARLGINFDANKLFYAASSPALPGVLSRIGFIDFSFDITQAISGNDNDALPGICDTIQKLVSELYVADIRMVVPPFFECWSIVPKAVFDEEDERKAHLDILMQGTDPDKTEKKWHPLSNRDFKLVTIRKNEHLDAFNSIFNGAGSGTLYSDFEVGSKWMGYSEYSGSFLSVSSYNGMISVSSYLLGKLRAATYFTYDDVRDLPYLWLQYASHLPWIEGLHEYVMVFGDHSGKIVETLKAYWDDSSEILVMNSLKKANLRSVEESYSFPLERAFPAMILSVS